MVGSCVCKMIWLPIWLTFTITGSQLAPLLSEFAKQRISALRKLARAERMELSKEEPAKAKEE